MPLDSESNLDIDSLLDEQLGSQDNSRPNISRASYMDPDQQAEIIGLAESRKVDTQTVENNLPEFQRREKVEAINTSGYPKLSQYLSDDRNSRVSIDDIDNLKGIEGAVRESESGFLSNIGRGSLNRVNTLTGNLVEFIGNVSESFEETLDSVGIPNPGIIIGDDGVSWSWDIPDETPNLFANVGKAVSEGNAYGYQPRFTWERFKGDMNPKTLAGYIAEQGVQSVPDMLAAIYTLPAYIGSRTEEIAEERVKNDERQDVTGQDLATSLIPAVTVSLIERIAGKVTLGAGGVTGVKTALKATGAATVVEGGTEFVQEGIEYLGETLGTKKDVSIKEMIDRQLAGLVAGSGMGASIRGTTSSIEAVATRAQRNVETTIMSAIEQGNIDQIATFSQSSTTRGRKQDRFRNFLKGLETEKQVHISSDAVIEAVKSGVELPAYMTEQLGGLGTDVTVNIEQFGTDIAPNEDIMAALRPDMRMSSDSLSQNQMEAEEDFSIKSLLERAEKSKAALTEAETIYEDVKQQLVDTGRQSEATARYSSAIIPAYATVKAEQTGFTVSEVYELMGLEVTGPATKVAEDGVALDQSPLFGDDNRLTNINQSGGMAQAIRNENPSFDFKSDTVAVYRATVGDDIRFNDYVAINRDIAEQHLENLNDRGDANAKLVSMDVPLSDLMMANDATEFVYVPEQQVTDNIKNQKKLKQEQTDEGKATRGTILIKDDSMIIKMGQASDLSTFLHESSHMFLEMESKFAEYTGEVTADQQVILDWLEVDSFKDIDVEQHEKFAESFEVYLREGKAPSLALRDAFAAFKRWLVRIYQNLTDQRLERADLNDEVREVFDRLLATEAEIELATANPAYDQFFRSKEQSGMSDSQWEVYLKRQEQTRNRSQETLDTKVMKELEYRYSENWKEEKAPLIEEETERLSQEPVYSVLNDTTEIPMDRKLVKEILGVDKLPKQLRGRTVKDGYDPEGYAVAYGYDSAEIMVNEMVTVPSLKEAADKAAEQRMIEKYGDILNDGTIEAEAQEAIHNETQAQLLLEELRALKPERANKINRDYLKAESKTLIGSMNFKEIQPNKYYRAEIKAAQKAVTATDKDQQYIHKVQQLANHYMYREAVDVKERMTKQRKYINQRAKKEYPKGVVVPSYAQNIVTLAKSYVMNDSTNIERVVNWMNTQLNDQNQFIDFDIYDKHLIKMLDDFNNGLEVDYTLTKFSDMTADELKGLYDQLRHLRYVGGKLTDSEKAKLTSDRVEASESIDDNAKGVVKPTHDIPKHQQKIDAAKGFLYSQRRIGGIFETLDGFKKSGLMSKEYSLINKASNEKLKLTDKMTELMDDAFKEVLGIINRSKTSSITKQDGNEFSLNHRARFTLALNWGNEGNRTAVIEGLNNKFNETFTENDITAMLSTMTVKELDAVNKVWAATESLWPDLSGVETRLKGVSPTKVQATPFVINGVKMSGGHYRLHYRKDPNDSSRTNFEDHHVADGKVKLGTASSAKERVGSGGRQVDLDLGHLFSDLEENIHYITHAELAGHMNAMFKGVDNPVVSSIIKGYGQPYYDNLIDTLSVLTQSPDPAKGMWKALRYVRMNLTYGFLIGSLRNIIQQPIAITNAFSQLGFNQVMKGAFMFYSNVVDNYNNIREVSPFMKNRTKLVNREAREQLMKIDSLSPKIGAMKNMFFLPQTFMDSLIAYPTWMAAYDKSGSVEYADEMVAKTIGSGLSKDLGSLFSKGEAESQITFMGTFFNLTYNLHIENAQLLKRGEISGMEYARRLGWMAVAPAILTMFLTSDLPDDDEKAVIHALKEIGYYNLSSIMLVRDVGTATKGFDPSIPGLSFAKGIAGLGKEAKDLMTGDADLDMETTANILRGLQPLVPMPGSGQVIRTMKGIQDPGQAPWGALVEGKDRNK